MEIASCLYGLNDASRQFFQSAAETLKILGCQQSSYDPALFFERKGCQLIGMAPCHVDDFFYFSNLTKMFDKVSRMVFSWKVRTGCFPRYQITS